MPEETSTASASSARPSIVQRARSPVWIISTLRSFPSSSISDFKVVSDHLLPLNLTVQLVQSSFKLPARFGRGWRRRFSPGIRTTRHVPECCGDGCRVSFAGSSLGIVRNGEFAALRFGKEIVEPTRVYIGRLKIACRQNPPKKSRVRFDTARVKLFERLLQAGDSFRAIRTPRNQFSEHRVVLIRHGPAAIHAVIEAYPRACRRAPLENFSGRWEEIVVGILGINTAFNGMAAQRDVLLRERKWFTASNSNLKFHDVQRSNQFGHRMLDLEPRVHFEEIKAAVRIHQELDGSRVRIPAGLRELHGGIAHRAPQFGRHNRRRRFFDYFLIPALHRTFALAEMNDVAMAVAENLDFDVPGPQEIFLEIEAPVAECVLRFRRSIAPRSGKFRFSFD